MRLSEAGLAVAVCAASLAVAAVVAGIWLFLAATRDLDRYHLMRTAAVSTEAQVTQIGRTSGESRRRFAVYQYTVDGKPYRGRVTLSRRDSRPLAIGSPLPVRYLPSQPQRTWLDGYEAKGVPLWLAPVVPAALLACAYPLFFLLRKQRRLLTTGRAATARVARFERVRTG
ncbi:MAG: DUF3592 domain-containing protein, partial [Bryobacteraceae bacterium]